MYCSVSIYIHSIDRSFRYNYKTQVKLSEEIYCTVGTEFKDSTIPKVIKEKEFYAYYRWNYYLDTLEQIILIITIIVLTTKKVLVIYYMYTTG